MPPKARITKDDIIKAGFEVVRREGAESLNVRTVGKQLAFPTQPIMYHFKTVDELRAAVYAAADSFHTAYLMNIRADCCDDPLLEIGLNYIRFGAEESCLFRFLFQSDKFQNNFEDLFSSEELLPLFSVISKQSGLAIQQAKELFETLFICAHGIASLLANNSMEYKETYCAQALKKVFSGTLNLMKRGNEHEEFF